MHLEFFQFDLSHLKPVLFIAPLPYNCTPGQCSPSKAILLNAKEFFNVPFTPNEFSFSIYISWKWLTYPRKIVGGKLGERTVESSFRDATATTHKLNYSWPRRTWISRDTARRRKACNQALLKSWLTERGWSGKERSRRVAKRGDVCWFKSLTRPPPRGICRDLNFVPATLQHGHARVLRWV